MFNKIIKQQSHTQSLVLKFKYLPLVFEDSKKCILFKRFTCSTSDMLLRTIARRIYSQRYVFNRLKETRSQDLEKISLRK